MLVFVELKKVKESVFVCVFVRESRYCLFRIVLERERERVSLCWLVCVREKKNIK